ncbi:unnamed protein product [Mytilus coruscus]|uniref:HTH psq-type domain-containing protein n=1 Tax=Mytilus coruscus TaxID=42192 RepID=A0A6J8B9R4_MYTCO|nr:unnamed protein product [Mytilus coruscus]
MKCTNESCKAEIPVGARFCTGCGTEVQTPVPVKTTLCPSCNNIVVEGYKFCHSCGGKIDPALFIDRVCYGIKGDGQKCNAVLTSGTKFCPSCGTPQDTSNTHDTNNKDDLPGDALLKLNLQITQQKEDNLDETTSSTKEEHGSSGSSSPEIWEAPTITLASNDKKTGSVEEIVQQAGSQMNPAKIELDVPRNTTDEQAVKTIETGEGLELTDQQSNKPQGSEQAGPVDNEIPGLTDQQTGELQNSSNTDPVDRESPGLTDQQTGESQNSSHTGPVDKEIPGLTDQQTGELHNSSHTSTVDKETPELTDQLIGKPDGNELICPDDKEGSGQTDQQTVEPKCIGCSSPIDNEGPGLRDQESGRLQGNENAGPVDKASSDLADKQAGEPEGSERSSPVDKGGQGLTDQKSSESEAENILSDTKKEASTTEAPTTEASTTETDTLKGATAEEMDVTETKQETNKSVQTESEITNMETQITGPQSDHSNGNGNQNSEKPNNVTEIDDQNTKLQGDESDRDKQEQKEKDIIENPSNVQKPEIKEDATETELQVILISDSESVEDEQGRNEELVNTNVKPTKRKLKEEEGQIKKIKGGEENENLDCNKGVQHMNTQSDEKYGIQETGEPGNTNGNTGQSGEIIAEQAKNTKDENRQDTEKTNKKPIDDQLVKQRENTDEEKRLKENSNQGEDQLPTKRITRSMQANKNGDQSNQTKELPKKNDFQIQMGKRNKYRNYALEDIKNAVQMVENKSMSIRSASRQYNVPKTTIIDKLNGRSSLQARSGPNPVLYSVRKKC